MNAKVVTFQMKPDKQKEISRLFNEVVIPGAKKQKGFRGGLLLTDPTTGKATSVALWETVADIKASEASGYYKEWVGRLGDVLALPPVREIYEVSNLDSPLNEHKKKEVIPWQKHLKELNAIRNAAF